MVECGQRLRSSIATGHWSSFGANRVAVTSPATSRLATPRSWVQDPTNMHFLDRILTVSRFAFARNVLWRRGGFLGDGVKVTFGFAVVFLVINAFCKAKSNEGCVNSKLIFPKKIVKFKWDFEALFYVEMFWFFLKKFMKLKWLLSAFLCWFFFEKNREIEVIFFSLFDFLS